MLLKMHADKRSKLVSSSLKTLSAAVLSALLVSNAGAAGLGKLTVMSGLGQPLFAEIELTAVSKEEAGTLVPKLASAEAFRQANIDLHPSLLGLRFSVEQRGERQVIRVTSAQPMNEPFVDLLLELSAANGRLVREYTFLLDPVELRTAQSPQVAPAVVLPPAQTARRELLPTLVQSQSMAAPPASEPVARQPAPYVQPSQPARPVRPTPAAQSATPNQLEVRTGDTLGLIARQNKPDGVSLDQMLVALYRANPDAFIDKNMNLVKAGRILTIPDAETANRTSDAESRKIVFAQAADFNEYRNRLAGQVAGADAKPAGPSGQGGSGKITAQVAEPASKTADAQDKLKLSKSIAGGGVEKGAGPAAGAEDKIAKDKALAEANSRVKELERNVSDMQKLLEMKNKDLAERQKLADAAKGKPAAPVATADAAKKAEPAASAAAAIPAPAIASAPVPASASAAAKPAPAPAPAPAASLLDHPLAMPGAAGLLVLLLGGLGFAALRKKRKAVKQDGGPAEPSLKTNSILGLDDEPAVVVATEVNTAFAETTVKTVGNEVDPIAEADVYIAYGRDAQAEEILKEALRVNPDRHPVRLKLMEIYANRKDPVSFEKQAREIHDKTGGKGELWAQAAALGLSIDAGNALYRTDLPPDVAMAQSDADLDALLSSGQQNTVAEVDDVLEMDLDKPLTRNNEMVMNMDVTDVEPVAAAPASNSFDDLDFDLEGLNGDQPFSLKATPETTTAPAAAAPPADMNDINFDFLNDTGLPPTPAKAPVVADSAPAELEDEFALMEADFAKLAEVPQASAPVAAAPAPMMPDFDLSEITLDLDPADAKPAAPVATAAAAPVATAVKEDDFNLQMDNFDMADIDAALAEETVVDDGDYSENAEMATKLDLAIAYEEIGDKEGARELLEEVVEGGTPDQIAKAKALLEQLA